MTQDNLSCLRFSIEESVWFQKGQEVGELLSISLDPNISIQEDEQYVSIRGALILKGEYKTAQGDKEEQSLREYTNGKQVQEVLFREDGLSEFQHQFPLDITIPKNRIHNMEDVYVTIDLFDYDLSPDSSLKLTADLAITGLYGEQQSVARVEEEQETQTEQEQASIEQEEIYLEHEEEPQQFEPLYRYNSEEQQEEQVPDFSSISADSVSANPSEAEIYEPFEAEAKKEQSHEEEVAAPSFELRAKNLIPLWEEEAEERESEQASKQEKAVQKYEDAGEEEEEKEKTVRKENALYLTQLFSKNEEEDFSRLKMCIVQNGDSLEKIAERYNTNVQNLLRVNNLEDEHDLSEGTILNIPAGTQR